MKNLFNNKFLLIVGLFCIAYVFLKFEKNDSHSFIGGQDVITQITDSYYVNQSTATPAEALVKKIKKNIPLPTSKMTSHNKKKDSGFVDFSGVKMAKKHPKTKTKKTTDKKKNKDKKKTKTANNKTQEDSRPFYEERENKPTQSKNDAVKTTTTKVVSLPINENDNNEDKNKAAEQEKLVNQWLETLSLFPNKENTINFIKSYKSGELDSNSYFSIIEELTYSETQKNKLYMLYAAQAVTSYRSYKYFVTLIQTQKDKPYLTNYAEKVLSQYKSVTHLYVLKQSLSAYANVEELSLTLKYLNQNIDSLIKVSTLSDTQSDEQTSQQDTNDLKQQNKRKATLSQHLQKLSPTLQIISNEAEETFADSAKDLLKLIEGYTESVISQAQ